MPWRFLRMEEHFELIKANFIRCEECNENFFFDFLRHPRYFVTHFKACHLKNLLYRFNGHSEEENHKTRFGPRRKRDANAWFGQLKSTEKRMISMQDNKWSEITENECWSCRLCNDGKADLTHVFELNELGRGQAFLHLRQFHEAAYETFLQSLPDVQNAALMSLREGEVVEPPPTSAAAAAAHRPPLPVSSRTIQQRMAEAERSRLRRLRATTEERKNEAERSKKRRETLTPVQRQADYDRRKRKKKRVEESVRSKKRREDASEATKEKEVVRSRERRRNATEEQRQREALRSRMRRQNATEEQKLKERERCRRRYEAKKAGGGRLSSSGAGTDDGSDSGHFSDVSTEASSYPSLVQEDHIPAAAGSGSMPRYSHTAAVPSSTHTSQPIDMMQHHHQQQQLLASQPFHGGVHMMMTSHGQAHAHHPSMINHAMPTHMNPAMPSAPRPTTISPSFPIHPIALYGQLPVEPRPTGNRLMGGQAFQPHSSAAILASGQADIQLGFAVNPNLQSMTLQHDHLPHHFFFESDAALLAGAGFPSMPAGTTRAHSSDDSTAV